MTERGMLILLAVMAALLVVLLVVAYRRKVLSMRAIAIGVDLLRAQDFSSRLASVGQRDADRIVEMFNSMMASMKAERLKLHEQNYFLNLLISESPMGIVILDGNYRVSLLNPSARAFLGPGAATGMRLGDFESPLGRAIAAIPQGGVETLRMSDSMVYRCSRLSFLDNGYAHPFILIEQLTREVVKAEKRGYEKVIRMMAHEVNNSMGSMITALTTASEALATEPREDLREIAEVMDVCRERCRAMGDFISSFARVVKIPAPVMRRDDMCRRVEASHDFLESMCRVSGVELEIRTAPSPVEADVDAVLFEQVLINIVKNSVESIGRRPDGRVVVTVEARDGAAVVSVADNGAGISPDTASHLFTPFYSTKPGGHGIGLLLISEVLTAHGCRFSLQTGDDAVTRFSMAFPRCADRGLRPTTIQ